MAPNSKDRWQLIEELFALASECAAADRARLLDERCGDDQELRREVESLLESVEAADRASAPAAPVPAADTWIGRTIGAYRLDRLIATGGMGAVYFARRTAGDFQQDAAFKLIATRLTTPWVRQRFLLERQTLASLQHPHISRLLDGGITEAGEPYLVMEYIEGRRLDEYCEQTGAPVRRRIELFLQLCGAVSFVHRNLIVHRDLKPGNVLVTESGEVKLLDFGAAKLLDPGSRGKAELTRLGIRPLTPQYASPEQIIGEAVTASSDIYSLGVILYKLLAGKLPFDDASLSDAAWMASRLETTPALPIGGDLDAVVRKALQPNPKDRYGSVDDLAADLRNFLEWRPVLARQGALAYRARKLIRRRARGFAAAAVVALACSGAGIAMVREGRVAAAEEVRARSGYNEIRRLARLLLFDFYDQVRQLQGSTDVQRQLVSQALEYLDKLSHDVAGDPGLQLDLVDAYTKMGNVLGNPYEENLGDAPKAIATLQKAEGVAEETVRTQPREALPVRRLAVARRSLAEVCFSTGDTSRAVAYSRAAAQLLDGLAERPDATLDDVQEAASTFDSLGDMHGLHGTASTGDLNAALEAYRHSLALQQRALARAPDNVRSLRGVAIEHMKIANAVSDAAPDLAAQSYRDALAGLERLPAQVRQSAQTTRLAGVIRHQLANLYISIDEAKTALPFLEQARERDLGFVRLDPENSRTRFDLATIDYDLASARDAVGDRKGARDAYREVLRTLDDLLQRDPANLVWLGHRSEALFRLSGIDWESGYYDRAGQESRNALALALQVASAPEASGEDFQRAADDLLEVRPATLQNPHQAIELARRAVEISRGANPAFLITLARAQRAAGDEPAAHASLQKVLALLPPTAGQSKSQARRIAENMLAGK